MKIKNVIVAGLIVIFLIGGVAYVYALSCCDSVMECCCPEVPGLDLTSYGCSCNSSGEVVAGFCKYDFVPIE
jgi:hypothetical protein